MLCNLLVFGAQVCKSNFYEKSQKFKVFTHRRKSEPECDIYYVYIIIKYKIPVCYGVVLYSLYTVFEYKILLQK